jgi:hypothetical protein
MTARRMKKLSPQAPDTQPARVCVYLLADAGKAVTWRQWRKLGGCGLSQEARRAFGRTTQPKEQDALTLGQLQANHVLAGRELARFAKDHLNRPEWAVVEYDENGKRVLPEIV